ncbi:MAG: ornithine cyclodeaminase family protein [Betaproteobacteria bacterium]|nr:MAG: ornithine cyclodeaminase family protein [Betaproteobacteria bacterium]
MLMINNDVVAQVLTMRECIEVQEAAFAGLLEGKAILRPRIDTYVPCDRDDAYYRFGTVEGASGGYYAVRLKSDIVHWPAGPAGSKSEGKYCVQPGTFCGLIFLYSSGNGEPLAIMNDGHLQHMRVGAAAGIGTRLLAREDASTVGMIGSGGMARTFLEAYAVVRNIEKVKVYSRNPDNCKRYADEMAKLLDIEVTPVGSAREAARGVDILSTCTDSLQPTIEPEWLEPGMHVVNLAPYEISAAVAARFDVKVKQGSETLALPESETFRRDIGGGRGVFVIGTEEQQRCLPRATKNLKLDQWPVYNDVRCGKAPGRTRSDQITHYRTMGNWGVQFSSVGGLVYLKAKAAGLGRELPTEWFLQDIRN